MCKERISMDIEPIWVYGVGGVGGFIGGKIAIFLRNNQRKHMKLYFIARGKHLEEIRKKGLILNMGDEKGCLCVPTGVTEDIKELPLPDLCFLCVKSYDLNAVCDALKKYIKPETVIIPLLNGVDIYERVRKILGAGIVLPACIYVGTHIEKPGVVTQKGGEGKILMGKDPLYPDFYPEEVLRFLQDAAISFQWFDNVLPAVWEKYLFIAGFGLVSAVNGDTLGQIMENSETRNLVNGIMEEIFLISKQKHIALAENIVSVSLARALNFPGETRTSYQRDVAQKGKQNEGDLFGETIVRMGKETGVPTPVTNSVYMRILSKT
jgi:2-dehydropantoate 2-reductase